jgi:hypothetical protein
VRGSRGAGGRPLAQRADNRTGRLLSQRQGVGDGVVVAVAEGEAEFLDPHLRGGFSAFAVEEDEGFAGWFALHFDVQPAELFTDASAEGLGDGFFGREPGGVAALGGGHLAAIQAFALAEDPGEESFAVTLDGPRDPRRFDDVHASAEDVHRERIVESGKIPLPPPTASGLESAGAGTYGSPFVLRYPGVVARSAQLDPRLISWTAFGVLK